MNEITLMSGKAEQLQAMITSGISIVQLVRESLEDDGRAYAEALYGAMMVLRSAEKIVDDLIEEAMER